MRLKKAKNIIELLLVLPLLFFIGDNNIFTMNNNVSNNNLQKSVEVKVIAKDQKVIADSMIKEPKVINTFNGDLTAYIGNCKDGCSGVLACPPRHVVSEKGIYHNDKTYGKVRIVATSSKYPCGSIMRFKLGNKTITAIALDRGVSGNTIDLLTETTYEAYQVGRRNIKVDVLRLGW